MVLYYCNSAMKEKIPILYSFRRCPYAIRARIILKLSGLKCEVREVNLKDKPNELLSISPKGTVPVLHIPEKKKVIQESLEIMYWALFENDPYNFYSNISIEDKSLIELFDSQFKDHLDKYKYSNRFGVNEPEFHRKKCIEILSLLEKELNEKNWLKSKNPNFVDIAILPFIRQFRIADTHWFDNDFGLKNVKNWLENFLNSRIFIDIMGKRLFWKQGEKISML